jgi:hypothetical protein
MLSCHQIDDIVKTKRNKMKKIVALVAVLFSVVVPVQAQANTKSLVIIDSYFQSSIATNPINSTGAPCAQSNPIKGATPSSPYNHGTAMYAVAKLQNPALPIIPICASSAQSDVFPDQLIASLNWVKANKDKVAAVSVSLTFNKTRTECMPANPVKKLESAKDAEIRALIKSLADIGIPVFASAGNDTNKSYSYPGCIADTYSVVHASAKAKAAKVNWANTSNTDYLVALSTDDSKLNYNTSFGLVAETSSSSTAAAAAMWVTNRVAFGFIYPVA